jgi:hypothetical protein
MGRQTLCLAVPQNGPGNVGLQNTRRAARRRSVRRDPGAGYKTTIGAMCSAVHSASRFNSLATCIACQCRLPAGVGFLARRVRQQCRLSSLSRPPIGRLLVGARLDGLAAGLASRWGDTVPRQAKAAWRHGSQCLTIAKAPHRAAASISAASNITTSRFTPAAAPALVRPVSIATRRCLAACGPRDG